MEQIINNIKKFKKIKLRFNLPTPKKILLYEDMHASILKQIINKDFNIIKVRENKEIYFWILIKQIILFDFTFNTYCKNFIKFTSPKIIITFIDNNIQFYKFKKNFKNITFISIQNGLRHVKWFRSKIVKNSNNLECDHIFVLNKYYIKKYQKIIKSQYHLLGGFKNNIVKIDKTKIYNNYLFISQFNKHRKYYDSFRKKLLNLINLFLNNYNKKIYILLRHSNSLKQREEIQYYNKIFQSNCIFYKPSNWKKSYELVDKFENIIFMYSTLGYEAFARKKKVAIFSPKKNYGFQYNFGWSASSQKKYNFFSAKNLTYNEIKRVLKNINNCSQMHWEKTYYSAIKDQLYFNKNNIKIKQIISKLV